MNKQTSGRILLIFAALIGIGIAAASMAAAPVVLAAADDSPEFDQYCLSCHGPDGRGVANVGVDLVASAFVAGKSEAELVEFLKIGRMPDDPASTTGRPMPGFAWVSESELKAVAAFVKARNAAK